MYENDKFIGWLRYNLFWDNTPFMNMLYFLDDERGKVNGSKLIEYWEDEMKKKGFEAVLKSTQSNEQAQFFYRKHNYIDSGVLTFQEVDYLEFKGLFKKTRPTGEIVYTAIYYTNKDQISEFIKNDLDENDKIMLWDLEEDIGYVDEIDNEIIKILQK